MKKDISKTFMLAMKKENLRNTSILAKLYITSCHVVKENMLNMQRGVLLQDIYSILPSPPITGEFRSLEIGRSMKIINRLIIFYFRLERGSILVLYLAKTIPMECVDLGAVSINRDDILSINLLLNFCHYNSFYRKSVYHYEVNLK